MLKPAYILVILGALMLTFQNCAEFGMSGVQFANSNGEQWQLEMNDGLSTLGDPDDGGEEPTGPEEPEIPTPCVVDCVLTPLTDRPAITTILLALGDEQNNLLVGNQVSNQFIVESVIRYSSPQNDPKILVVKALDHNGEDPEDTIYVVDLLSNNYDVTMIDEPADGLTLEQTEGYDLVWFNNPGYPFSKEQSLATLLAFSGAVVLQGDDLSRGRGFSMTELTGLEYIDNGVRVTCDGQSFRHDNNRGEQYRVTLDDTKIQGLDQTTIGFRYGNDIDNTVVVNPDVEVIATAFGGPDVCTEERPVITRRLK